MIQNILLALALVFVGFLIFGFVKSSALKSLRIEKSVTIPAASEKVFEMVQYLEKFPQWSPFLAQDPGLKYNLEGVDGQPGARYHWNGRGGKDVGFQEIVEVKPHDLIRMRCDITKPFVAKPTFDYHFQPSAQGIEVKQIFQLQTDAVSAFFMWLFGAKAEMEKTNQQGLDLLKKACVS